MCKVTDGAKKSVTTSKGRASVVDAHRMHDYFNLITLPGIIYLNSINWDFHKIWLCIRYGNYLSTAWEGEYGGYMWVYTSMYFIADMAAVTIWPQCVKSPATIQIHHIVSLISMYLVHIHPQYLWFMGANLFVEINTWFLIVRRIMHKDDELKTQLKRSWSILPGFISFCFYVTWIFGRSFLLPFLWWMCFREWAEFSEAKGSIFNIVLPPLTMQTCVTLMCFKWTYDLFTGKYKAWRSGATAKLEKGL
mmetsp:Transcript_7905/g.11700  ORF Transcript_7905/g.11700 Transcript_7905/m.11700 type:complete len:249 (+) Transcript_7905:147-893(+)